MKTQMSGAQEIKPEKLICINFNLFSLCTILENELKNVGKKRHTKERKVEMEPMTSSSHRSSLRVFFSLKKINISFFF
jgi:hypothetical protein